MALIHANVFDAALNHVKTNADTVEVRDPSTSSAVLATKGSLGADNWTGPSAYSSASVSGRNLTALVSHSSDMKSISVAGSGGNARTVALVDTTPSTGATLIVASISSPPVALGGSDKVNLGTFSIILKDPS